MTKPKKKLIPIPKQKWLAVVLCAWMSFCMLLGYILFDGPICTSLTKIESYDRFKEKLAWVLGKNPDQNLQDDEADE